MSIELFVRIDEVVIIPVTLIVNNKKDYKVMPILISRFRKVFMQSREIVR